MTPEDVSIEEITDHEYPADSPDAVLFPEKDNT
jgi:hypothetical protein